MTGEIIKTYHDESCPKCGFPETIDIRDKKTMKLIGRECSKGCGWKIGLKELSEKSFGEAEFKVKCKDNKVSLIIHNTELVVETKQNIYSELFDLVKERILKEGVSK